MRIYRIPDAETLKETEPLMKLECDKRRAIRLAVAWSASSRGGICKNPPDVRIMLGVSAHLVKFKNGVKDEIIGQMKLTETREFVNKLKEDET